VKKGDTQELPVNCGDKEGTLYQDKLSKGSPSLIFCYNLLQYAFIILFMGLDACYLVGEKCILSQGHWFTPSAFEKFGGKERLKNWKFSIRYQNTPLKKLIEVNNADTKCVLLSKPLTLSIVHLFTFIFIFFNLSYIS